MAHEIQQMAARFGLEKLGFLTLTFADHVTEIREAQRRFNNLNRRILKARYRHLIAVVERQASRRLHFHLVVVLPVDIRTGFDFAGMDRRDYRSANPALRAEWAYWRQVAPGYGFGRTELLPVRSSAEGIARYVGKYVSKHIGQREEGDKGHRMVRYIGFRPGDRRGSAKFGWNTVNGWLWRQKLQAFARRMDVKTLEELREVFGPSWCYLLQGEILSERIDAVFPSELACAHSRRLEDPRVMAEFKAHQVMAARPASRTYVVDRGKRMQQVTSNGGKSAISKLLARQNLLEHKGR